MACEYVDVTDAGSDWDRRLGRNCSDVSILSQTWINPEIDHKRIGENMIERKIKTRVFPKYEWILVAETVRSVLHKMSIPEGWLYKTRLKVRFWETTHDTIVFVPSNTQCRRLMKKPRSTAVQITRERTLTVNENVILKDEVKKLKATLSNYIAADEVAKAIRDSESLETIRRLRQALEHYANYEYKSRVESDSHIQCVADAALKEG